MPRWARRWIIDPIDGTKAFTHGVPLYTNLLAVEDADGIADIDLVMQDGYSTSRGMGLGLPGAKRLMDEFTVQTQLGGGTTITCRKWRR